MYSPGNIHLFIPQESEQNKLLTFDKTQCTQAQNTETGKRLLQFAIHI